MPCTICKGEGKYAKNGNHTTHNRSTCTKTVLDFVKEVIPTSSVANIVNDYLFAPYPSLPDKLKVDIRMERIKEDYSTHHLYDDVLDNLTYWDIKELERCNCCHRHHPRRQIVPNRWAKRHTLEGKKCSCPCRHILRQLDEIAKEQYFDDWEY